MRGGHPGESLSWAQRAYAVRTLAGIPLSVTSSLPPPGERGIVVATIRASSTASS